MSFEILNAENRNAGFAIPVRRCCSFCRNPGHNIQTCNDTRLYGFEQICIVKYRENIMLGAGGFYNWILEYSVNRPNLIKSYAVRFCSGITIRHTIYACIDSIYIRIRNIVNAIDNNQQEQTSQIPQAVLPPNTSEEAPNSSEMLHNIAPQFLSERENTTTEQLINLIRDGTRRSADIALALMFINMIQNLGRDDIKYNIATKIIESSHTNECECGICYENKQKKVFVKLNCGHEFCKDCVKEYLKNVTTEDPQCAFCRTKIKNMELTSQEIRDEFNELIDTSI
jgi:hypothetical protein